ncbi:MAG: hypothetical protein J7M05_05935, partial [Anaerolineae bacterium]|nr:hypothetical protein [Anaerolineae bacterium]
MESPGQDTWSASGLVFGALALFLSVLAALPLLVGAGMVNTRAGGDAPFLLQRVYELSCDLRAGALPARWMPNAAYGLGYPAFNFYAAFPYYVAAVLNTLGTGILWSIKLTQLVGFILAGGMSYLLARELGAKPWAALLSSAIYTFAPFHLVNVYVRGDALSEFTAMALYPLLVWALLRLVRQPSLGRLALLSLSYALLVLSHNISALVFSPLVGVWLLVEALSQRRKAPRILLWGGLALGLGLLLSAWFWIPALRERSLVQLGEQTTGYFHYSGHFRWRNLVQWSWAHDYAIDAQHNPFSMGGVQAALAVAGTLALFRRWLRREKISPSLWMALGALFIYTWLITPWSAWVWEHVPLLPYVQFPWRLLSVQALAIALLAGQIPVLVRGPWRGKLALALVILATLAGMVRLRPDRLPLREEDVTLQRLMLYETYSGNIGGTVRYEYLPREMVPRPYTSAVQLNNGRKPAPLALEGQLLKAELLHQAPQREEWQLTVAKKSLLAFQTTFYPGWEAQVDGHHQGVEPLPGLGLVGLRLPAGEHHVVLYFSHTPTRRYANLLSTAAWLFWLGCALPPCWRWLRGRRWTKGVLIGAACLTCGFFWRPELPWRAGWEDAPLVMDFARAPYLHPEPAGILFGQAHLLHYALEPTQVRPGDELHLRLEWATPRPKARVRVRLYAATAHLLEPSPFWVEAEAPLDQKETTLYLRLPRELPPGLYVLRVNVYKGEERQPIRTSQGRGMDLLALKPIQVMEAPRANGQERVLGTFGPERVPPVIALVGVQAKPKDSCLEVTLHWRSERQAPLNYMLSLRLRAPDGQLLASRDLPPLLGIYPTSLWRPG